MKSKFATIDLCAVIHDLNELKSMRVVNVYDINSKTYLIKLQKPNDKAFILFESGIRIHRTSFEWPKAMFPSGFSMKFRKHINQKRLTNVQQVGTDRIIDLQFGDEERSCHVIVELYDRGNVVLTDHNYIILNVLRPRTDTDHDVRFSVKEKYPLEIARKDMFLPSPENILLFLENAKTGDVLKKTLNRHIPFSSTLLDHALMTKNFPLNTQIGIHVPPTKEGAEQILEVLKIAEQISSEISQSSHKGYIAYTTTESTDKKYEVYQEYYPYDFVQFRDPENGKFSVLEFENFSEAVDKFYSSIIAQKNEQRILNAEKEAERKLDNIKKDHEHRIMALEEVQAIQEKKGELVQCNREVVEQAMLLIRAAIANKMSWDEIPAWVDDLGKRGVEVATKIVKLNLASNLITMSLKNVYEDDELPLNVDIDVGLTADQNVRKYFGERKAAVIKQDKTLAASNKALKSATQQIKKKVEQVQNRSNIIRARKTFWFEKFHWFISSDSYLVVAGRDAQQNELLVRRYFRPGDIYVHAEIQGAASVIVRNHNAVNKELPLPPRTLNEAGTVAICYSSAWEAKVVINAWWVRHDQVSRTAQTGEFLPTGSFMIRGKKNFLPTCQLQLGFGIVFRLDEESLERHRLNHETSTVFEAGLGTLDEKNDFGDEDDVSLKSDDDPENGNEFEKEKESEDDDEFPDVQIDLKSMRIPENNEEFTVINLTTSKQPLQKTETDKYLEEKVAENAIGVKKKTTNNNQLTKRQKHKLNKINKKYKDQDEEERALRLKVLGSAGAPKIANKKPEPAKPRIPRKDAQKLEAGEEDRMEGGDVEETNDPFVEDEMAIVNSLIAMPETEDTLLFAMTTCAPYSAMQKYKFKVKVTPGTGKRGRAVKTALSFFLANKTLSPSERILIKSLGMDDFAAQCMPSKVRISAPALMFKGRR